MKFPTVKDAINRHPIKNSKRLYQLPNGIEWGFSLSDRTNHSQFVLVPHVFLRQLSLTGIIPKNGWVMGISTMMFGIGSAIGY